VSSSRWYSTTLSISLQHVLQTSAQNDGAPTTKIAGKHVVLFMHDMKHCCTLELLA
jgi:hypothetical protein